MSNRSLESEDLVALGSFADAGLRAIELALARAARSHRQRRIPIAGAAVHRAEDGALSTICVGHNGRIPASDGEGRGYPSDHGETSAIRQIADVAAVDWSAVVFATTLSPCIMCGRSLEALYHRGLRRLVIAESRNFSGTHERLAALEGMQVVELGHDGAMEMMQDFARCYPWDWAADIGQVPPSPYRWTATLESRSSALAAALSARGRRPVGAVVIDATGAVQGAAGDERAEHGHNPVYSAPMRAIGRAGSAVNLRECAVACSASGPLDLAALGPASLGVLELFRPAAFLCDVPLAPPLRAALEAAGVPVWSPGPERAPGAD